jgi:hypothetical protein
MLRVKVELVPYGDETQTSQLTEIIIGNDSTGGREIGNYDVFAVDPRYRDYPSMYSIGRIEGVQRFPDQRHAVGVAARALEIVQELRGTDSLPQWNDVAYPPNDWKLS